MTTQNADLSFKNDHDRLVSRRDLIGLSKPTVVAKLKTSVRAFNVTKFSPEAIRIYMPESVQVEIKKKPWRIQLFDFEEYQARLLYTRLFTRLIEASLISKEEFNAQAVQAVLKASVLETILDASLHSPRTQRDISLERDIVLRSPGAWAVVPNASGTYEYDSMEITVAEARMKKRVLRFDYRHQDGSVVTRRVKLRPWTATKSTSSVEDLLKKYSIGFLAERHGKIRSYRFDRCSNMYMESLSSKKLQDEFEIVIAPDGDAAVLTLKLADD